jgi:hypothetical protein
MSFDPMLLPLKGIENISAMNKVIIIPTKNAEKLNAQGFVIYCTLITVSIDATNAATIAEVNASA